MNRRSRKGKRPSTQLEYSSLEQRNLLAIDISTSFTGATFQTESTDYPPETAVAVGTENIVEALNGHVSIYNKDTGTRQQSFTLDEFFLQAGGFVPTTTQDPNVIFDHFTQRWFVSASGTGAGNWIHLAFSTRTMHWTDFKPFNS